MKYMYFFSGKHPLNFILSRLFDFMIRVYGYCLIFREETFHSSMSVDTEVRRIINYTIFRFNFIWKYQVSFVKSLKYLIDVIVDFHRAGLLEDFVICQYRTILQFHKSMTR